MNTLISPTNSITKSIIGIIEMIDSKCITLPEFQRNFVWDISRTYELFDSFIEYTRDKTIQYIRAKEMVLEYLKINGSIKNSTIRELCGYTKQQARAIIDKMIAENLIFKVWAGSATEYKLK